MDNVIRCGQCGDLRPTSAFGKSWGDGSLVPKNNQYTTPDHETRVSKACGGVYKLMSVETALKTLEALGLSPDKLADARAILEKKAG